MFALLGAEAKEEAQTPAARARTTKKLITEQVRKANEYNPLAKPFAPRISARPRDWGGGTEREKGRAARIGRRQRRGTEACRMT